MNFIECEDVIRYCERTGKIFPTDTELYRQTVEAGLKERFKILFGVEDAYDLVFVCNHCDTIVWGGVDYRLDPDLECPHCKGYKTNLPYWTYEDICNDYEKEVDFITVLEHSEYVEATRKRYEEKGLHDWEYWKKDGKKWIFATTVKSVYHSGRRGLTLHIWKKDDTYRHDEIVIPISADAIYDRWIYPHTKKAKEANKLPF